MLLSMSEFIKFAAMNCANEIVAKEKNMQSLELLGQMILDELKSIRSDMKDEIRKLGLKLEEVLKQRNDVICVDVNDDVLDYDEHISPNLVEYVVESSENGEGNTLSSKDKNIVESQNSDLEIECYENVSEISNFNTTSPSFDNFAIKSERLEPDLNDFFGTNRSDEPEDQEDPSLLITAPISINNDISRTDALLKFRRKSKHNFLRHKPTSTLTGSAERSEDENDKTLKQYKCNVCGQTYGHASSMRRHRKTHSGVKPYKCHICEKLFNRKEYLLGHINTHRR
ncbi:unnamed protein product [Clavelina lepadiformis]|uniref:C2H2-type domain-containing protein n=1 Tax=Clavelina lepadiformis TaxID=159417 RepID=A0ABP0G8R5_CLALP